MQPPLHKITDAEWFDDPPQEPGYYWFYGDPYMGEMGGHYNGTVDPEYGLQLVEIHEIANGVMGVSNGQFIPLEKWNPESRHKGVLGKWAQVIIPNINSFPDS